MDGSQPQKSRVDLELNCDYISNLPADVKDNILMKLRIKEAVRTSILSSKWKDSWASIPNLVFKEKCAKSRLIKSVDKVLLHHHGPILKFKLVSKHACNEEIGGWMLFLSRNGIEDLKLKFDGDERCVIPSRFFSCVALKHVSLSGCVINDPRFFQGFNLLRNLWLEIFDLSGFCIEKLVSNCPLLDRLVLSEFELEDCLNLRAPNLTYLHVEGAFDGLCLDTPKLASGFFINVAKDGNKSNITRVLGGLSEIQRLHINGEFIAYLAMGPIPEKLPIIFNRLKKIDVHLYNSDHDKIATALCLFRSAPNLEVLYIEFLDWGDDQQPVQTLWESEATKGLLFKCLKIVNIIHFAQYDKPMSSQISQSMLEFAKLVLSIAPVLKKLNICNLEDDMAIGKKLESFPKLSNKAEVVFVKDYDGGDLE